MTKRDVAQIIKLEHDEASNAKRVKIADTEMSMELNHKDGDSVTAHPDKLTASSIGVATPADDGTEIIPPIDCSSLDTIRVDVDGAGAVVIEVSPNDSGAYFYAIGSDSINHKICARRVRVISTNADGDVHLVGKS